MRIYGSVQICFWENSNTQTLSDQGKLLAIYLLTGPHSNMIGSLRLPDGYIIEDLRWDAQIVKNTFQELSNIDFLTRDENTRWLTIHQFLKWNPIQNPKQGIGIQKLFDLVPSQSNVVNPLIDGLLKYGKYLREEFVDRLHTLKKNTNTPFENSLADKDQDQDQNQNQDQNNIYIGEQYDSEYENDYLEKQSLKKNNIRLLESQAIEVLNFLNEKSGKCFRPVDTNLNMIIARLKTGATVTECRQIIAMKYREWKKNPEMMKYVRPKTLFCANNFESYIGELVLPKNEENQNEKG